MLSLKNAGHFVNRKSCFKSFHEFRTNIQLTMFKVWLFLKKNLFEDICQRLLQQRQLPRIQNLEKNLDDIFKRFILFYK